MEAVLCPRSNDLLVAECLLRAVEDSRLSYFTFFCKHLDTHCEIYSIWAGNFTTSADQNPNLNQTINKSANVTVELGLAVLV